MLIGYGRISKGEDQDDTLQVEALKEAGCKRIFLRGGLRRALEPSGASSHA